MTSRQAREPSGASQATDSALLLDVAREAAAGAAESIRRRAGDVARLEWKVKRPADFVSEVDTEAEHRIREVVARRLPSASILGEELTPDARPGEGIVFVADPLDGTTNFLHRFPWYAVSIGVLVDGVLEAGVVLNVPTGDRWTARRGHGAWLGDDPVRVSQIVDPSLALVGTGFPFKHLDGFAAYVRQFEAVTRATSGIRRPGSAALDLVSVACGQFEAFWELMLAPWDIAAGTLIVREAGGVVTDLTGSPAEVAHTGIVAGNPAMHRWLLDLIAAHR